MTHGSNVFYRTIVHQQAMFGSQFAPLHLGAVEDLPQMYAVVRMSSFEHPLDGGLCGWVESKYPIRLVGPVDFPARDVPSETSRPAQSLCFGQVHLAPAQRLLGLRAFGSFPGFAQRAPHRGREPRQPCLHDVIGGPDLQRFDRHVLAERAGDEDERQVRAGAPRELQRGNAVERRKLVIREDQVDLGVVESGHEPVAGLGADDVAGNIVGFKEIANKLRVTGVVLQQQNAEGRCHFFTLPGGGSLMTAQKMPSSLTALTNSWKSTGFTT